MKFKNLVALFITYRPFKEYFTRVQIESHINLIIAISIGADVTQLQLPN